MKNGILVLIVLQFIFFQFMIGQTPPPDYQWVIKGGQGIQIVANASINYPNDLTVNSASPYIEFLNFTHPSGSLARNDVFIIYEDGRFFNSYTLADANWNDHNGNGIGYYINNPQSSSSIQYLYWTNRYEGDDLEEDVKRTGQTGSFLLSDVTVNSDPSYFNVNHDIVPNTDVTLIIKRPKNDCEYSLEYNLCDSGTCSDLLTDNFNMFSNTNIAINHTSISPNNIQLAFNNKNIAYVNFRVNGSASQYAQQKWKAKFILTKTDSLECRSTLLNNAEILVPINAAHDPNFMQLNSICKNENDEILLNYYVQVMNDSENASAENVKITLPMPTCVDLNDIFIQKIYYNGNQQDLQPFFTYGFNHSINGNSIIFRFPGSLNSFVSSEPFNSVAGVEFCVKAKSACDLNNISDMETSLLPELGSSEFTGQPFGITTFFDLDPLPKDSLLQGSRPTITTCECDLSEENLAPLFSCSFFNPTCSGKTNYSFWGLIGLGAVLIAFIIWYLKKP